MLDKEPELIPEWGDQYVIAEILLPQEGMKWPEAKWYAKSMMSMVTPWVDPIRTLFLDTCLYGVEFPREEMTELAGDIIAEC